MEDSNFKGFSGHVDPIKGFIQISTQELVPNERVVFEESKEQQEAVEAQEQLQRLKEEMALANRASRTKFATGNVERDVFLYKEFKGAIDRMVNLLDG